MNLLLLIHPFILPVHRFVIPDSSDLKDSQQHQSKNDQQRDTTQYNGSHADSHTFECISVPS